MPTNTQGIAYVDTNGNKSILVNMSNCRSMNYTAYQQLTTEQKVGAIIVTDYPVGESVSVTADGVKTNGQLLTELYNLVDYSKVTTESVLIVGATIHYRVDQLQYTSTLGGATWYSEVYNVKTHEVGFVVYGANGNTITDVTNNVVASGTKFTLYYNSDSSTASTKPVMLVNGSFIGEFATDADYVSYGNGSVKDALDRTSKSNDLDYGTSLNDVKESGLYYGNGVVDSPLGTNQWCMLMVIAKTDKSNVKQIAYSNDGSTSWERHYKSSTWSAWTIV